MEKFQRNIKESQKTVNEVKAHRDNSIDEQMDTFKAKAELSSDITFINKVEKPKPFKKKYEDLK